jgi:hypothetical protein
MPIEIVLARHALRAPFDGKNKLRCTDSHPKLSLMRFGLLVTFQVFSGVFAVSEVYLTGLACVGFMSPQV